MKITIALLLICATAFAESPDKYAEGAGSLRALLHEGQFFILKPPYAGEATLVFKRGNNLSSPTTLKLHFTHYTPNAAKFNDPGTGLPHRAAIFEGSALDGDAWGHNNFTFCDDKLPDLDRISHSKTLSDLKRSVSRLLSSCEEGDLEPRYWYNCFLLTESNRIHIFMLTATCDKKAQIKTIEVWTGDLAPE